MKLTVINSGSKGNCYLFSSNKGEVLIIEAGIKVNDLKKTLNFELSNISGCVWSHLHKDHSKGLREFLAAGIDCYSSKGTIAACGIKSHRLHEIEKQKEYKIGSFKVIAFSVNHDCAEPFGFLIQHPECGTVLFITDSSFVGYKFPGLNNIIIEANYCLDKIQQKQYDGTIMSFLHDRIINSHMSIQTCMELLNANDLSQVNNIVLIHLSDSNSDAKQFKKKVSDLTGKTVYVAEKGLEIPFGKTPF
jgi:phosphoribosyl 1,2-cyclic phosphodiesterase